MSEQQQVWDVYLASYENDIPGSTTLRMDLVNYAPIENFNNVVITGATYKTNREDLFPESDSFDLFYKIADDVLELISKECNVLHAGSFTSNLKRLEYFYIDGNPEKIKALIEEYYEKTFTNLDYYLNVREDENWDAYLEFLYPNETTLNYMNDEKVVRQLEDAGDDLSKPRQVNHWIYFASEDDRKNAIAKIIDEGFQIEETEFDEEDNIYSLQISRTDYVHMGEIPKITMMLRTIANEHNGEYDGWETQILKS